MSEMLEKVAAAIYAEFERRPDYAQRQMNGLFAEELAIAAVRALREPDEGMKDAGMDAIDHVDAWVSMIDSILSTPTTRGEVK